MKDIDILQNEIKKLIDDKAKDLNPDAEYHCDLAPNLGSLMRRVLG